MGKLKFFYLLNEKSKLAASKAPDAWFACLLDQNTCSSAFAWRGFCWSLPLVFCRSKTTQGLRRVLPELRCRFPFQRHGEPWSFQKLQPRWDPQQEVSERTGSGEFLAAACQP